MTVAFDAQGHIDGGAGTVSSVSGTPIAVGSGSNRALCVGLAFGATAGLPTSITVTWDVGGTNQALTAVTGATATDSGSGATDSVIWYALKAPTSGTKTLTASWTGARSAIMGAISFTGVDQTGGATSFAHGAGNSGNITTPATVTITSATGNATVAIHAEDGGSTITATSATQDFIDATPTTLNAAMNHTAGAASNTMTATVSPANTWASAGFDVVAAAGAAAQIPYNPWPQLGPISAQ